MVGIKLADGGFYPVLDERGKTAKRLVLTTVRDEQTNVQIDLYRGEKGKPLDSGGYIASLVLESIPPSGKGEADIELLLSIDEKGYLAALAKEIASGEYQSLRLNIQDQGFGDLTVPDFSFEEKEDGMISIVPDFGEERANDFASDDFPHERKTAEYGKNRDVLPNFPALAAFVLFGFVIVFALVYLFFSLTRQPPVPFLEAAFPCIPFLRARPQREKK